MERARVEEVEIDVCRRCLFAWLDAPKREALEVQETPAQRALSDEASARMRTALREAHARRPTAHRFEAEPPESPILWALATLGLPVSDVVTLVTFRPQIMTSLALSAVILLATVAAWSTGTTGSWVWGSPDGSLGTIVGSFFVQPSFFALLTNLYFLLLVGADVESVTGRWGFLSILALGHGAGLLVSAPVVFSGGAPYAGAGAGVTALLTVFARAFPRTQFRICFWYAVRVWWFSLPAWLYVVFFVLVVSFLQELWIFDGVGPALSTQGLSQTAFVGGALVGLLFPLPKKFDEGGVGGAGRGRGRGF